MQTVSVKLDQNDLNLLSNLCSDNNWSTSDCLRNGLHSLSNNRVACGIIISGQIASGYILILRG
jgi:hypothetical protein